MIDALREAIEFAEQDGQALTPAGKAMIQRWRDALAEAESATPAAWRYRYNGQWYLSQSKSFALNGFDVHPLYATLAYRISTPASAATGGGVAEASAMPWQVYEEPCATRDDFMREMAIQAEHTIVADPTLYLVHDGQGKTVASTWGGAKARANAYAIAAMSAAPPPPAQAADGWADAVEAERTARLAAEKRAEKAEKERDEALRWKEERSHIVGFNDGFAEAIQQVREDFAAVSEWPWPDISKGVEDRLSSERWPGAPAAASWRSRAETAEAATATAIAERDAARAEVARLRQIVNSCDWFWPEDDTSEDACQFSAGDIYREMPEGEVIAISRGGVVETRYYAWLSPADDADSDDDFEVDEASEDAAQVAVADELARRAALATPSPEPGDQ